MAERGVLEGIHRVVTPEYVEFDFVLGGLMARFLAWLLDLAVVAALTGGSALVILLVFQMFPGLAWAVLFVAFFLIDWGYGIATETFWSGQTLGKKLLGLRVIQTSGVRIGFTQAVIRNLARAVDRLPLFYLLGASVAALSRSQQRLGDMLAGTVVVKDRRTKAPASIARPATPFAPNAAIKGQLARISPQEREVLVSAALRREELAVEARLKLFAELSEHLQKELGIEKPSHLSDENLVVWVVASLVAPARSTRPQSR